MIIVYSRKDGSITSEEMEGKVTLPADTVWLDLVNPTEEEEKHIEQLFGINVPNRQEIRKIEVLSRFTEHMGILFMTATIISHNLENAPVSDPITFIMTDKLVITCRYSTPRAFEMFARYLRSHSEVFTTPDRLLWGLVQAIVNRLADVLDVIGLDLDTYSHYIFRHEKEAEQDLQTVMSHIGRSGELLTRINESLHSIGRLISFMDQVEEVPNTKENKGRLKSLLRDLGTLHTYSSSLTQDVNFLLNATLGLINMQQNRIIKIFSVAAVIFLPPTLVASIYGMNFHHLPELSLEYGYPMALLLMLLTAVLPYLYFKRKGWL